MTPKPSTSSAPIASLGSLVEQPQPPVTTHTLVPPTSAHSKSLGHVSLLVSHVCVQKLPSSPLAQRLPSHASFATQLSPICAFATFTEIICVVSLPASSRAMTVIW